MAQQATTHSLCAATMNQKIRDGWAKRKLRIREAYEALQSKHAQEMRKSRDLQKNLTQTVAAYNCFLSAELKGRHDDVQLIKQLLDDEKYHALDAVTAEKSAIDDSAPCALLEKMTQRQSAVVSEFRFGCDHQLLQRVHEVLRCNNEKWVAQLMALVRDEQKRRHEREQHLKEQSEKAQQSQSDQRKQERRELEQSHREDQRIIAVKDQELRRLHNEVKQLRSGVSKHGHNRSVHQPTLSGVAVEETKSDVNNSDTKPHIEPAHPTAEESQRERLEQDQRDWKATKKELERVIEDKDQELRRLHDEVQQLKADLSKHGLSRNVPSPRPSSKKSSTAYQPQLSGIAEEEAQSNVIGDANNSDTKPHIAPVANGANPHIAPAAVPMQATQYYPPHGAPVQCTPVMTQDQLRRHYEVLAHEAKLQRAERVFQCLDPTQDDKKICYDFNARDRVCRYHEKHGRPCAWRHRYYVRGWYSKEQKEYFIGLKARLFENPDCMRDVHPMFLTPNERHKLAALWEQEQQQQQAMMYAQQAQAAPAAQPSSQGRRRRASTRY